MINDELDRQAYELYEIWFYNTYKNVHILNIGDFKMYHYEMNGFNNFYNDAINIIRKEKINKIRKRLCLK